MSKFISVVLDIAIIWLWFFIASIVDIEKQPTTLLSCGLVIGMQFSLAIDHAIELGREIKKSTDKDIW